MLTILHPQDAYFNREQLLTVFERMPQPYSDNLDLLTELNHYWLYFSHPDYGVTGGIRLTPPNQDPAFLEQDPLLTPLYAALGDHWLATHLFFALPQPIKDIIYDAELMNLMHQFYSELYSSLQQFSGDHKIRSYLLVNPAEHHYEASIIGGFPFCQELFLDKAENEEEYAAGFLYMDVEEAIVSRLNGESYRNMPYFKSIN